MNDIIFADKMQPACKVSRKIDAHEHEKWQVHLYWAHPAATSSGSEEAYSNMTLNIMFICVQKSKNYKFC